MIYLCRKVSFVDYYVETGHSAESKLLTHWGRVTHICVSKLSIIGSDIGLSPGQRQAIIWYNDGILLIRTLAINFSEILSEIHSFSFNKMHFKISSAKWRLFCLGLGAPLGADYPKLFTLRWVVGESPWSHGYVLEPVSLRLKMSWL